MPKTTQYKGIVGQTAGSTIIGEDFERVLGDWLADALEVQRNHVVSGWQFTRETFPDAVDVVAFSVGAPSSNPVRENFKDNAYNVRYSGSVDIHVYIYGENSRLLSMLLVDTFSLSQNCEELHRLCGLGYVDSAIEAQTLEPVGSDYRPRADVRLTFNYRYERTWHVRTLVESPDVSIKSEV